MSNTKHALTSIEEIKCYQLKSVWILLIEVLSSSGYRLDQMFSDAFSKDYQLLKTDPKHSLYLACALMVRGNVEVSDVRRNIERFV